MWLLRSRAEMASSSRVLRGLIRNAKPSTLEAMHRHFAARSPVQEPSDQPRRPSLLLDASDLERLDQLTRETEAPSRSAAARFLILHASPDDARLDRRLDDMARQAKAPNRNAAARFPFPAATPRQGEFA